MPKPHPILTPFQRDLLRQLAADSSFKRFTFTGGTALAEVYLRHRLSEDLDFFSYPSFDVSLFFTWLRRLSRQGIHITQDRQGNRFRFMLKKKSQPSIQLDFVYFPFEAIEPPARWQGLRVDSLLDIAVNKVHAVASRLAIKDYVDLYFIFKERSDLTWPRLLKLVRLKLDVHLDPLAYAEKLAQVQSLQTLPTLIKPLSLTTLHRFFLDASKQLAQRGWTSST